MAFSGSMEGGTFNIIFIFLLRFRSANLGHRQAVALGAGLRRERVLVALGKGRYRGFDLDAVPDDLLRFATGWDFGLAAAGHHSARAELLFHLDAFRSFQAGRGFRAGWPGSHRAFDPSGHLLLQRVVTGELLRFRGFRTGAPGFRACGLLAGTGRFRHDRGPVFAGLLDAILLLAKVRQAGILALLTGVRTSLGRELLAGQVLHDGFTENFEHLRAGQILP